MIDYKKLYSELSGPGEVSPEMVFAGQQAERSGAFRAKHPEIFDADHPLAFGDAQNTAQKAKDKSDELQEAFKAASKGNFDEISKATKLFTGGFEKNPMYNPSATGINAPPMFRATKGEYAPNTRIFAGEYYDTDQFGNLKTEAYEMSRKMNSGELVGFAPMSGGKASPKDSTPPPQTHSSNVARYGYTPQEITPEEQQRREDEETPWWKKPQDTTPEWLKKKRADDALKAANDANKK